MLTNPLPVIVSVTGVEPVGTDVGAIEVMTSGVGGGVCVLPPLEAAGLELPQPETTAAANRHTATERKAEDKQDFMVESSIAWCAIPAEKAIEETHMCLDDYELRVNPATWMHKKRLRRNGKQSACAQYRASMSANPYYRHPRANFETTCRSPSIWKLCPVKAVD